MVQSSRSKLLVNFVVLRGGGGHYSTYKALQGAIEQHQLPWELSVTYADTIGDRLAANHSSFDIYRLFGTNSDDFYDWILQHNWTWAYLLLIRLNKLLIKLNYEAGVKILAADWRKQQPDLVVSVVPFFNRAIWDSVQRVKPNTPVVTILTDFADCPPAYWLEPQTKNYVVCGTDKAVEQARHLGIPAARIVKTSGLVINPRFYQSLEFDRSSERQLLGLDPNCPTGLVLFGANGSKIMLDLAERLASFGAKLQLIFICGRNQAVAKALQKRTLPKRLVIGFSEAIPYYMQLSDFFIGKPGNVSISEAIVMKLPVIVEGNWATLPQERYVIDWVRQQQVGLVVSSFKQINRAVEQMLQSETYARYRANVEKIGNRAVWEIPVILQGILATHDSQTSLEQSMSSGRLAT